MNRRIFNGQIAVSFRTAHFDTADEYLIQLRCCLCNSSLTNCDDTGILKRAVITIRKQSGRNIDTFTGQSQFIADNVNG